MKLYHFLLGTDQVFLSFGSIVIIDDQICRSTETLIRLNRMSAGELENLSVIAYCSLTMSMAHFVIVRVTQQEEKIESAPKL
jgi:hypothetical protein